ncbi:hypothetical protein B9G39_19115 [Zooshikella ganghwensis]|uniref:Uncharacterized protein n=1 Tax=Zooshikella ganghwensis TaxID=202772 RepID=A0A4P9VPG6_9GAMM|nr:hypothetical protein B9G39_19115 [Zooshikella ganghwensis]
MYSLYTAVLRAELPSFCKKITIFRGTLNFIAKYIDSKIKAITSIKNINEESNAVSRKRSPLKAAHDS